MSALKKYLGIDFSKQYQKMWENLRQYTEEFNMPKAKLKKKATKNKKRLKWATTNGKKYQIELNNLCYKAFNNLNRKDKMNFFNFILDTEDKDLYVIIANKNGIVIYKSKEEKIRLTDKIEAKKDNDSNVGYTIFIKNIPTYRIQTNNTNGIGISPFCQRVFKV